MKKFLIGLTVMGAALICSPTYAAVKPLTSTQLKAQIAVYQKQIIALNDEINNLQSKVSLYESDLQPMVDLVSSTKAVNLQLNYQAQQSLNSAQQAINLANYYKGMCSNISFSNPSTAPAQNPVINSTPVPVVTPIIKCFTGTIVECFDYSKFSPDLIAQLNAIAQKPVTMQSIIGDQLRAIHNAGF